MPHDTNLVEIKEGDEVVIRYIVRQISRGSEFCNCQMESVNGRKPDGLPESYCGNLSVAEKVKPTAKGQAKVFEIEARGPDAWNSFKYPAAT